MASTVMLKSASGRDAAVLTTGEVDGDALDLTECFGGFVTVDLSFTLGSLTNCVVRFKASTDGVTYDEIRHGGTSLSETLTASAERCYTLPSLAGWRYFTVSVQGSGTVTSSSCAYTYRYLKRGSQL